jgi:hypothetical protein
MEPHGELSFNCEMYQGHQLLVVRAIGPFNEEGRGKAGEDYMQALANTPDNNFSIIEIWDDNALGSEEVMRQIGEFWANLLPANCIKIAIVPSNFIQVNIIQGFLPTKGQVFSNEGSARAWIELS